jgi:hypothetical protein
MRLCTGGLRHFSQRVEYVFYFPTSSLARRASPRLIRWHRRVIESLVIFQGVCRFNKKCDSSKEFLVGFFSCRCSACSKLYVHTYANILQVIIFMSSERTATKGIKFSFHNFAKTLSCVRMPPTCVFQHIALQ